MIKSVRETIQAFNLRTLFITGTYGRADDTEYGTDSLDRPTTLRAVLTLLSSPDFLNGGNYIAITKTDPQDPNKGLTFSLDKNQLDNEIATQVQNIPHPDNVDDSAIAQMEAEQNG